MERNSGRLVTPDRATVVLVGAAASEGPPERTDWRTVLLSGTAIGVTVAAFLLAIKVGGKAAR